MEWWISRYCEEFHCTPDKAIKAWTNCPAGLMERIVDLRAYASAKRTYETAQQWDEGPEKQRVMRDPLVRLVKEIDFSQLEERTR